MVTCVLTYSTDRTTGDRQAESNYTLTHHFTKQIKTKGGGHNSNNKINKGAYRKQFQTTKHANRVKIVQLNLDKQRSIDYFIATESRKQQRHKHATSIVGHLRCEHPHASAFLKHNSQLLITRKNKTPSNKHHFALLIVQDPVQSAFYYNRPTGSARRTNIWWSSYHPAQYLLTPNSIALSSGVRPRARCDT